MKYIWVIGGFSADSEQGKYALSLAQAGIGYHHLNKDRTKGQPIIVGFKYPEGSDLPAHLEVATYSQIEKLDKADDKRKGIIQIKHKMTTKSITDIFGGGSYYKLKEASQGSEL